jgi:hypothetical protein
LSLHRTTSGLYSSVLPPLAKQYRVLGQDEQAEPEELTRWDFDLSAAIKSLESHLGPGDEPPYDLVWIEARYVSEPWDETERMSPGTAEAHR